MSHILLVNCYQRRHTWLAIVRTGLKYIVFSEIRNEAEETVLVVETACIFCEVQAEAEEIVEH